MCLRHHLFFLFFTKKECDVLFEGLNVLAISVPEALAKEWDKGLLEQKSYFEKKEKKAFDIGSVPISQLCHPAVKRIPPFRKKLTILTSSKKFVSHNHRFVEVLTSAEKWVT